MKSRAARMAMEWEEYFRKKKTRGVYVGGRGEGLPNLCINAPQFFKIPELQSVEEVPINLAESSSWKAEKLWRDFSDTLHRRQNLRVSITKLEVLYYVKAYPSDNS